MRMKGYITAALAGLLALSPLSNFMMPHSDYRNRGSGKRRKTGRLYPHSSTRQRARYARQIAAGQLNMEGARNG
ncbi:hypothetical protein [Rhizobium phaseoli]|uniref:hypothetical protein n=1 Tax=Rhizobium phaseoli TaxID=396 RepID=UPI0025522131|nr:hypothetical protein [Rhizobium phaseoli]MDK4730523.1 hypothetical protein [Rhizobium phaseoli]